MAYKPTFVLEDEIDELSYDFRTKSNPSAPHGVIPEPTTKQLQVFQRKIRKLMEPVLQQMTEAEGKSQSERLALAFGGADGSEEDMLAKHHEGLAMVAELCSDTPSVDDIEQLPHRAQQVFIGWIAGVFMDPEAQKPVSTL